MVNATPVDVPEMFGPYRIVELLGRGGMSEVHRAYDTMRERYVALKRVPRLAGVEFENRFRREAKIVARLQEPHVVPIHGFGEIDGQLYLDMRLMDGPDLKRLLADGPLDPPRAIEILSEVATALDAAHAGDVLHRDVKPANVLLDAEGAAYLADFGIARLFAPDVTVLTETDDQIGTLDYMAPERLTHGEIGPASDVYSLACMLFQCLTGRVPFPAMDSVGKLAAQLNDPPPAASLFDRRIPPAMDLVVRTGMDKDPRRRYPSAGELMAAAAAVMAGTSASAAVDVPDTGESYFVRLLTAVGGQQPTDEPEDAEVVGDRCPYPGLRSFSAEDSDWFFGREQALRDLLVRLSRQRADSGPVVVVGASGAGKSSLLHAGLLAARGAAAPRLAMTPGAHPVATLAARMASFGHAEPHRLGRQLTEHPETFGEVCQAVSANAAGPMIIVVDQAEELFTQCAEPGERAAFAAALANAWPARVVLAVRADFVERCFAFAALIPALRAAYVLAPLTAQELALVVTKPAEAAGVQLEPGLVDRLITDVGAGDDPGALPRLAHALRETWHNRDSNRLTLAGYQRTGGVDRAVALTADGVYERLGEHDRHMLRAALLRMVTVLDGGGIARRRVHRGELPDRIVESLVAARLVTTDRGHVQLAHDALLTAWPRLRAWVTEDRHGMLVRQRLGDAVAGWRASGQDRADLYRGVRLVAALDWAAERLDLTPDEHAFLHASERDRRRRVRRLQGLVVGLAALLAVALVAGVVAVVARNDAERERLTASSRLLAAESLAEAGVDPVGAMRKAIQAWQTSPTTEARGALLSAPMLTYPTAFRSGLDTVYSVDVNPDGTLVAVGSGDGRVVVWDVAARKPLDVDISAKGLVAAVRFSPDGTLLATSALGDDLAETGIQIWEIPSGRPVRRLGNALPAFGMLAWRPDGQAVAAESVSASATLGIDEWDPLTGKLIRPVASIEVLPTSLAYNAEGDRLAIGGSDGSIELWATATASRVSRHTDHADNTQTRWHGDDVPVDVAVSGTLLASSSVADNMIRLWDPHTGAPVRAFADTTSSRGSTSLAFDASGRTLYTNSGVNSITAWDSANGANLPSLTQGPRAGTSFGKTPVAIAVSRDGRTRVAANNDGTVLRWHTNPNWYSGPQGSLKSLAYRPDGTAIFASDTENSLYTWDTTTGNLTTRTTEAGDEVLAVVYAPDGTRITGTSDATFTVTPATPGLGKPRTVTLPDRTLLAADAMVVSPDGRWLAAAHDDATSHEPLHDNKIHIWDVATLTEHAVLDLGAFWPRTMTFTPDGSRLLALTRSAASTGSDPNRDTAASVITWTTPDFNRERRISLGTGTLDTVVYAPGGKTIITTGTDGTLQIRDATTGRVHAEFGQHPSTVRQLAISPDGRTLASVTTEETTIRLWDLTAPDHHLVATLNSHLAPPNEIVFSPDGTRLASGGTDVAVWQLEPDDAARQVCTNLIDATPDHLDTTGCG